MRNGFPRFQGCLSLSPRAQDRANPSPDWITTRSWRELQALECLPKFTNFVESFEQSLTQFKAVFDAQEAHLLVLSKLLLLFHRWKREGEFFFLFLFNYRNSKPKGFFSIVRDTLFFNRFQFKRRKY